MTDQPLFNPAQSKSRLGFVFSWMWRGGVCGFVLWICLWTLKGFSAFVPDQTQGVTAPPVAQLNPLQLLSMGDLDAGAWSFQDGQWDLTAESHDNAAAKTLFVAPPPLRLTTNHVPHQGSLELLSLLKRFGNRTQTGPYWMYDWQYQGNKVVAFEQEQLPNHLAAIRWLIPLTNDRSWILEQKPRADSDETLGGSRNDPLGQDGPETFSETSARWSHEFNTAALFPKWPHRVLARRFDQLGRMLCLLVQVDATLNELIDGLARDSWKTSVLEARLADSRTTVHVTRDADSYWMIVSPASGAKSLQFLLIRDASVPGIPDTRVKADEESP